MKILFVCTGNTCRSPMAEGLAKTILPGEYLVSSAGLHALHDDQVNEKALAVLSRKGIDISQHRAKKISKDLLEEYDLIVTMTNAQKRHLAEAWPEFREKVVQLGEWANQVTEVLDPWGRPIEVYEQCAQELEFLIRSAGRDLS